MVFLSQKLSHENLSKPTKRLYSSCTRHLYQGKSRVEKLSKSNIMFIIYTELQNTQCWLTIKQFESCRYFRSILLLPRQNDCEYKTCTLPAMLHVLPGEGLLDEGVIKTAGFITWVMIKLGEKKKGWWKIEHSFNLCCCYYHNSWFRGVILKLYFNKVIKAQ